MKIDYPVAIDSNYAIWKAFNNEYWPALYFVDARGRIRHHQFGEGAYEESEAVIQQLLAEAGFNDIGHQITSVDVSGVEHAAASASLRSSENYLGSERTEGFASPGGAHLNQRHVYAFPARLSLNHWALSGNWTAEKEAVVLTQPNGRIAYCFHARDLNLIMGPIERGSVIRFGTKITSSAPGSAQGLYLVVSDIVAARNELVACNVDVSEVFYPATPGSQFQRDGASGRVRGPAPDHASYSSFATFSDPDGNGWLLQEVTTRLPGRGLSLDLTTLTELLRETEKRHGEYEATAPKHHWSNWYAAYIVAREKGRTADEAAADATLHLEQGAS